MAENLIKSAAPGESIVVHDVVAANVKRLLDKFSSPTSKVCNVRAAKSVADLAASCSVIITMVPNTQHVKSLMEDDGIFRHASNGALVIDCSTIDPITSRELSAQALQLPSQLVMMDAPVSGGVTGAAAATLTFMCGGSPTALGRATTVLSRMGKKIVHCGDAGSGGIAKLCNNLALAVSMAGTAEAMNLGIKMGMDGKKLAEVMNSSTARCWSSDSYNPVPGIIPNTPASRAYEGGFASQLMLKDLDLALGAGIKGGLAVPKTMPMGTQAKQVYESVVASGRGGKDFGSVYDYFSHS